MYVDRVADPRKTNFTLKSVLGTEAFATTSDLFVRDMDEIGGTLYAVVGDGLYSVNASGSETLLGAVTDADGSQVFGDGTDVCVVAGGNYYVWDGSTLSQPSTGAFSSFGSGTFLNGYVVLSETDARRFQWSDLADASTLPALNFSTADGADDKILRLETANSRLLIMKEHTVEVWYVTGQSGANAFQRATGGVMEVGLKAKKLATKFRGGVFWVGDDNIAYISSGSGVQPVSGRSPAVESALENKTPTDVFYTEDEGHKFCHIRFSDTPTWVYDVSNGKWHERAYGVNHAAWPITVTARAYDRWFGGNVDGEILRFARNNTDVGASLRRTVVCQPFYLDGAPFRVPWLEFSGRVGTSSLGRDATLMLRVSGDNGKTWGPEHTVSMGDTGDYEETMEFYGLGWFDKVAVPEVSITDPAELTLNGTGNVKLA